MKKLLVVVSAMCVFLCLGLTACGSTYAKITGVIAGVGTDDEHPLEYNNSLSNTETLSPDDYVLQVGESYILAVAYTASGGSRFPLIDTENIELKYDTEILQIEQISKNIGDVVKYSLTCKKAVAYTSILVEVSGEYYYTVIISAN